MTDEQFQERRDALESAHLFFIGTVKKLFPVDGPVTWRNEAGYVGHGTVVKYWDNGQIRVVDDQAGFYSNIDVYDVMRATP